MRNADAVLIATLLSSALAMPGFAAPPACAGWNEAVPPGANTTRSSDPFFIDTTGLDLKTTPPTRDPSNPDYPRATALPDKAIPSPGADGNFVIGATHPAASDTVARSDVPKGTVRSFTMSSTGSVIYRPGTIRDDAAGCLN